MVVVARVSIEGWLTYEIVSPKPNPRHPKGYTFTRVRAQNVLEHRGEGSMPDTGTPLHSELLLLTLTCSDARAAPMLIASKGYFSRPVSLSAAGAPYGQVNRTRQRQPKGHKGHKIQRLSKCASRRLSRGKTERSLNFPASYRFPPRAGIAHYR